MIESLLIFCIAWIVYVYAGYPLCVYILSKTFGRSPNKSVYIPSITILIPAYNEADHIAETIENKLALNYPAEKVELIVISDESDDGTDEIVQSYSGRGVKLIRQVPRKGKTSGLNLAMSGATGEIVVFSDANSIYEKDALRYMMENFADPSVGYVTGKMVYVNPDGNVIGDGCSAYMRYENALRKFETRLSSVVGVDGGIDAVRRLLYRPMNADQLPDFVLPLSVVEQGYKVVYEERALLNEESLSKSGSEFRMRVRVSLRALWALFDKRALFNSFRFPVFSWELLSHKLLRYLVFLPQGLLIFLNLALLGESYVYGLLLVAQIIFYLFAYMGHVAERSQRAAPFFFSLPYYLVVVNAAAAQAAWMFLKGEKVVLWKPRVG